MVTLMHHTTEELSNTPPGKQKVSATGTVLGFFEGGGASRVAWGLERGIIVLRQLPRKCIIRPFVNSECDEARKTEVEKE